MLKILVGFRKCSFFSPKFYLSTKEILNFSKPDPKPKKTVHQSPQKAPTKVLVIHPVLYPNEGPNKELYLAEEAIGLAKALNWSVVNGPFWKETEEKEVKKSKDGGAIVEEEVEGKEEGETKEEEYIDLGEKVEGRGRKNSIFSKRKEEEEKMPMGSEWSTMNETDLKNGDYVVTPCFSGIYHKGGIIVDLDTSSDDDGDIFHEWKNKLLRTSIAKSSLMKIKKTKSTTFFTKGKLYQLAEYIRDNKVDALFVNTELSPKQIKTLEKTISNVNNNKPFLPKTSFSDSEQDSYSEREEEGREDGERTIRVFDRFTIILQIFAKRARTKLARLQIELCFLNFLKTKLVRSGGSTFSSLTNLFEFDLMAAKEVKLEVVSARERKAVGTLSGGGETQLETERRVISAKEAKLNKELESESNNQKLLREKRRSFLENVPKIALIGYTNSGKSALMNQLTGSEHVKSDDILFQTLDTTTRKLLLPSGNKALILDTIGFITNLPHELVQSFKSTLEEVIFADIVLHVRDIANEYSEDQKKTVLSVLKEIGVEEGFYTKKMIEVWNKIDLLEKPLDYSALNKTDSTTIPISALYGTNCEKLMVTIEKKINSLLNRALVTLTHGLEFHGERLKWLHNFANMTRFEDIEYIYEGNEKYPNGYVKLKVNLDPVTHRRYLSNFGMDQSETKNKGLPTEDWKKNSKSYFQKNRKK